MSRPKEQTISVVIATYGDLEWEQLAFDRAKPSAEAQEPDSIVSVHLPAETSDTLAEARNIGAEDASCDWLCFLDADDELAPGFIAAMRKRLADDEDGQLGGGWGAGLLAKSGLSILSPALQTVSADGHENPAQLPNRHEPMTAMNHCVIGTLVPRALFLELGGFRSDLPIYEDWALFLACVRAGATIVDVPDAVYRAHDRPFSRNQGDGSARIYWQIRNEHLRATA